MPFYSRLFSVSPRIEIGPDRIEASTSIFYQITNLGIFKRTVLIDSKTRKIDIQGRWFWFFKSGISYRFNEIMCVTYGYSQADSGASYATGKTEGGESFLVGVRLEDSGREVPLFSFTGEGEFVRQNGYIWEKIGDLYEQATDTVGTQQEDSLQFVDLLCERLAVPLGSSY